MNRRRQHRAGWRGSFLFLLAVISAVGPSWAANYICPMARAESAKSRLPACCAHRQVANASSPESYRVACHCPIPKWQAGAVNQGLNQTEFVPAVSVVPAPSTAIVQSRTAPTALLLPRVACASGPPLWVRNLSILC